MKAEIIQQQIIEIRGQKVMLDFHLANLYDIETRTLKQASNEIKIDFQMTLCSNLMKMKYRIWCHNL